MWPLFLDRDGVVNRRIVGDYVRSVEEFEFLPGALDALVSLASWAPRIVIVTNQQGVGRGIMSARAVDEVHAEMTARVAAAGGRIDDVLVCPHLAGTCRCRKPLPGMPLGWLADHPEVDPSRSVMVGDSDSDIAMGRALACHTGGCRTVRIGDEDPAAAQSFPSLAAFAASIA
ncbi:D-glycero-D-manno-heptose 1,7-bisphosphate phosphatase [Curtobacterium sp. 320]|uniref:D-glycero-alpha-D-manno-heptose-1,7-bisphosphate 7-phosphatase n=1 Tax=Curtobacterium sp. 320 TaxID=2817749 RepID=UPI002865F986|nr:HAD family hydrolase [Curtobacterium sp. 320]MDR6573153.1 D-glycero-D-manno-heptose 1,7-bisphosphate phosphatase [Curtobacterium sp. 320]